MLNIVILDELFDAVKIKIYLLIRQIILVKCKRILKKLINLNVSAYRYHLHLKRHLGVVQEPVFSEKANVIIALDEGKVGAYVELVLIFASHLKQDLFLS